MDDDYAIDADPFGEPPEEPEEIEEEDLDEEGIDDEYVPPEIIVIVTEHTNRVADNERITYNKLTKYEKTRLISSRAEQLARGAQPLIEITGETDVISIAQKEVNERKIPFIIRRPLHDKDQKFEEWNAGDLIN